MGKLKALLLTQGMHGMISQVEGLAKALDLDFIHEKIELNNFWKLFPPKITPVKNFVFKEDDPIDIFLPIALVVDLAKNQKYVRLEFDVKVRDAKNNTILWKKFLKPTLTESNLNRQNSVDLIMQRAAKIFVSKCFSRLHSSD